MEGGTDGCCPAGGRTLLSAILASEQGMPTVVRTHADLVIIFEEVGGWVLLCCFTLEQGRMPRTTPPHRSLFTVTTQCAPTIHYALSPLTVN